ncbi:MAG: phytoene desaturase family protein [Candidatus Nanopelagicales bacterium]
MTDSCVILGAGHNGLAAACYLAQAGMQVTVLEKNSVYGGAAISAEVFPGVKAKLSRYSYLVALLPTQIREELGLNLELLSRNVSSFTPEGRKGLLVERTPGQVTRESFIEFTGSDEDFENWLKFYSRVEKVAKLLSPTLLSPLMSELEIKALVDQVDEFAFRDFFTQPIGKTIDENFISDTVKGIVLTDALIGTFTDGFDQELLGNRCFLYHLIGDGTGEWKVPKGGMGAVTDALYQKAISLGVKIILDAQVTAVEMTQDAVEVVYQDGKRLVADYAVSNIAPSKLAKLRAVKYEKSQPDGSQIKMNLLLKKLPRLKSGHDPKQAFAGTFHINESLSEIKKAFKQANSGQIPDTLPAEIYCHTLTDNSILSNELNDAGFHTITLFGLMMKASLFDDDAEVKKESVKNKYLAQINEFLDDDIYDCLASDKKGELCVELKTPQDIEESVGLPRGHIFHEDLQWPFAETASEVGTWGTETDHPRLFMASSAAKRGGGVSAITGRNAAMALLQSREN